MRMAAPSLGTAMKYMTPRGKSERVRRDEAKRVIGRSGLRKQPNSSSIDLVYRSRCQDSPWFLRIFEDSRTKIFSKDF